MIEVKFFPETEPKGIGSVTDGIRWGYVAGTTIFPENKLGGGMSLSKWEKAKQTLMNGAVDMGFTHFFLKSYPESQNIFFGKVS